MLLLKINLPVAYFDEEELKTESNEFFPGKINLEETVSERVI